MGGVRIVDFARGVGGRGTAARPRGAGRADFQPAYRLWSRPRSAGPAQHPVHGVHVLRWRGGIRTLQPALGAMGVVGRRLPGGELRRSCCHAATVSAAHVTITV